MPKVTLNRILEEGFEKSGSHFGEIHIYKKDNLRILYDPDDDHIISRYIYQHERLWYDGRKLNTENPEDE